MAENKWRRFERLVAAIHKAADAGAIVKWDDEISDRQFDVTIRFRKGLYDHLTVVECKDYEKPVPVEKVEAFVTKSRKVQANVAVLASASGFQSGARACAKENNITLLQVTTSDDVDPSVFGAKWGAVIDMLQVQEITLEFLGGEKTALPIVANVLTYYANHTILETGSTRYTLDSVISPHSQTLVQRGACDDYVIPLPAGTAVTAPQDGVIPLKPLRAVHLRTEMVKARTFQGPYAVDPSFLLPNVNVHNVNTGEDTVFKYSQLPFGLDNTFQPGKFYEAAGLGYFYFCEGVKNSIADIILIESFQHGQLLQATLKLDVKYAKHYISVTDKNTLQRLQLRLDRYKAHRSD